MNRKALHEQIKAHEGYRVRLEARFLSHVSYWPESGCWLWMACVNEHGYGKIRVKGRSERAHRVSCLLFKDSFDDALVVMHKCDTPACVNPDHLVQGTKADNTADMMAKGRHRALRGAQHTKAVLTEKQVRKIRADYLDREVTQRSLAAEYGVGKGTIQRIVDGSGWTDVV